MKTVTYCDNGDIYAKHEEGNRVLDVTFFADRDELWLDLRIDGVLRYARGVKLSFTEKLLLWIAYAPAGCPSSMRDYLPDYLPREEEPTCTTR